MKRLLAIVLAVFMFSAVLGGCTPAKKPVPPQPAKKVSPKTTPMPAKKVAPKTTPMPTSSSELHKLSTKLAADAAKVKGVKKATVVMSKTTAYVGLDMNANIEAGKTNTIKKEVKDRIHKADKRLTRVYVSSNADVVTRIKKVGKGIEQGKPISSFTSEIEEIGRRIAP